MDQSFINKIMWNLHIGEKSLKQVFFKVYSGSGCFEGEGMLQLSTCDLGTGMVQLLVTLSVVLGSGLDDLRDVQSAESQAGPRAP